MQNSLFVIENLWMDLVNMLCWWCEFVKVHFVRRG